MRHHAPTPIALSVLALLALPAAAWAHPHDGAPSYAQPPPAYGSPYPVAVAQPAPEKRWSIGMHLGGIGLESEQDSENKTEMGAIGVHGRYKFADRWAVDLSATHMEGELDDSGSLTRKSGNMTLGVAFYFNPKSDWQWTGLFGVGGTRDQIVLNTGAGETTQASFQEGMARLGVGLERRYDRWGFGAQLFAVGMERDDEELDGPAFVGRDQPVPEKSSGGLMQLFANYYF